jgi:cytochrome c556
MRAALLILLGLVIGALGAGYAVNALNARDPLPRAVMTVMDHHFDALRDAVKSGRCEAAAVRGQLAGLQAVAADVPAAFPGVERDFLDHAERLGKAITDAANAAPADCPALAAALKPVGEACKSCHDQYR